MAAEDEHKKDDSPEETGWQYKSATGQAEAPMGHEDATPEPDEPAAGGVEWTASEFVAHEKGFGWYVVLTGLAAIIAAAIYLITKDIFSVSVVLVMAVIFGVSGSHKPRIVTYRVDGAGLTVGNKFYPYAAYKSFSMPQQGPFAIIELMPMKHLALPVGAFLAPDSQNEVLDMISNHLPLEHNKPGMVDELMHHLRF